MAAGTAANVTTGKHRVDGGIYVAPVGTTLPTDAASALANTFKNLGYISEDGVSIQMQRTSENIKEWNGAIVDSVTTELLIKIKAKFIESLNTDLLKVMYGESNVAVSSGAITAKANAAELNEYVFVIDTAVKGGRMQRRVYPRGKLTELGDIALKAGEATAYDATITAFVGSDGDSEKIYISAPTSS